MRHTARIRAVMDASALEPAAAKAEPAARAEARRILDNARTEAESILERAHRQGDADAAQARAAARKAGEREVATLTAVAREQTADAERRQQKHGSNDPFENRCETQSWPNSERVHNGLPCWGEVGRPLPSLRPGSPPTKTSRSGGPGESTTLDRTPMK